MTAIKIRNDKGTTASSGPRPTPAASSPRRKNAIAFRLRRNLPALGVLALLVPINPAQSPGVPAEQGGSPKSQT